MVFLHCSSITYLKNAEGSGYISSSILLYYCFFVYIMRRHIKKTTEKEIFSKNQKKLKKGIDKQIDMLYNIKACTCCELPYEALDH